MRIASKFNVILACATVLVLMSGTSRGQSYSPLYPPATSVSGGYQCLDEYDRPVSGGRFDVGTAAYLYTNAHFRTDPTHVNNISSVSPTSGYANSEGVFNLTLTTKKVGQAEALIVKCSNPIGSVTGVGNYAVEYDDVYYNHHSDVWVRIGGSETGGGTNHGTTHYNRYMNLNKPLLPSGYGNKKARPSASLDDVFLNIRVSSSDFK